MSLFLAIVKQRQGTQATCAAHLPHNHHQISHDSAAQQKLPSRLIEPGLFGPLYLHDDAVLHDRQDGSVTEPPQGVSNPGQGGIGGCRVTLRRGGCGGAGRLAVRGLGAHGFLEGLMERGILERERHVERGSDHVLGIGEKHADLAGSDGHPLAWLERQIAGRVGWQVNVQFTLGAIGPA
jgi:hypothetical protein